MNEFKRKEKIKLLTVAVICLIGIIGVVSYTFSFFQIEAENSTVIKGEAATADLTVNVTKIAPTEETELGLIPQLSEYITTAVVGRNNKSCINDNGNEVCQVYQIHVTNVSTTSVKVDGTVELTAGSNSNLKWAQISHAVTTQNQTKPTLLSEVNNHDYQELVTNVEFTGGQERNYYIVVWIEEIGSPQLDRGEFSGKVVFKTAEKLPSYEQIDNSGANAPGYVENLVPVMHNGTTWVTADTTSSTSTYGWYDYDAKKWANAVLLTETKRNSLTKEGENYVPGQSIGDTEAEGVLAFYVWIPRYKYKVWNIDKIMNTDSYGAETKGIEIEFIVKEDEGTITCSYSFAEPSSNAGEPNEECEDIPNGEGYYTHPAFKFGNDNLTGFWMGKFELSSETPTASRGGGDSVTLTSRILPNVISWRGNWLTNYWKVIKDMQITNNIYGLTIDITKADSHMLTNMEWGAVAYLSHSKYGNCTGGTNSTCTEIYINDSGSDYPYYINYTGRSAGATISSGYKELGTYTYDGKSTSTNEYVVDKTLGTKASTTGNIYGVYDMSGGSEEYVMGNMSSESGSYIHDEALNNLYYVYEGNEKYVITYADGASYNDQKAYNRGRLGDATSEVAKSSGSSWYSDSAVFLAYDSSWFTRGNGYFSGEGAGVFGYYYNTGAADRFYTARAALAVFTN